MAKRVMTEKDRARLAARKAADRGRTSVSGFDPSGFSACLDEVVLLLNGEEQGNAGQALAWCVGLGFPGTAGKVPAVARVGELHDLAVTEPAAFRRYTEHAAATEPTYPWPEGWRLKASALAVDYLSAHNDGNGLAVLGQPGWPGDRVRLVRFRRGKPYQRDLMETCLPHERLLVPRFLGVGTPEQKAAGVKFRDEPEAVFEAWPVVVLFALLFQPWAGPREVTRYHAALRTNLQGVCDQYAAGRRLRG